MSTSYEALENEKGKAIPEDVPSWILAPHRTVYSLIARLAYAVLGIQMREATDQEIAELFGSTDTTPAVYGSVYLGSATAPADKAALIAVIKEKIANNQCHELKEEANPQIHTSGHDNKYTVSVKDDCAIPFFLLPKNRFNGRTVKICNGGLGDYTITETFPDDVKADGDVVVINNVEYYLYSAAFEQSLSTLDINFAII